MLLTEAFLPTLKMERSITLSKQLIGVCISEVDFYEILLIGQETKVRGTHSLVRIRQVEFRENSRACSRGKDNCP